MITTKNILSQENDCTLAQNIGSVPRGKLPSVDLQEASLFLGRFGTTHTYQTADDKKIDKSLLSKDWWGPFAEYSDRLVDKNLSGAAVWFGVNECKSPERNNENITRVRALPVDLDESPVEPLLAAKIKPHIVVESSRGKYQGFWFVDDCESEQFRPIVLALAKRLGGDFKIANLCQVMRIPGFYHQKKEPFRVRVHTEHFEPHYKTADIIEQLGLTIEPEAKTKAVSRRPAQRTRRSDPANESERNQKLIEYAGELENNNYTYDEILDRLRLANARYNPPETGEWVVARANSAWKWRMKRVAKLDELYEQLKSAKQAERINMIQEPEAKDALRLCEATDRARWYTIRTDFFKNCVTELKATIKTHPIPVLAPPSGVNIFKEIPGAPKEYPGSFDVFPVVDGYYYQETPKGVSLFKHFNDERQDEVCHTMVFITKRLIQGGQNAFLEAAWLEGNKWHYIDAPRGQFFNEAKIKDLADRNFPVGSANARPLAQYLQEFEATFLQLIPKEKISQQMGWHGHSFLLGQECISSDDTRIKFYGQSDGELLAAKALSSRGTYQAWAEAVNTISRFQLPMIALYSSLGASVLKILGIDSFAVDFSERSSTGKTVNLRIAASAWGQPVESLSPSMTRTWNATSVSIERLSSLFSDLPLILDDTQQAINPEKSIKQIFYGTAGGQGRSRGSKQGLQATQSWRNIVLSCGEAPAISYVTDGGIRGRVVTLSGCPFGEPDQESLKIVEELKSKVRNNYGHAGPMFVKWLVDNHDRWPEFRAKYDDILLRYKGNSGMTFRLADHAAVIATAGQLVHEALDLPWKFDDPMVKVWPQLLKGAQDADICDRAALALYDYAVSNPDQFYDHEPPEPQKTPRTKWVGRWDNKTTDKWTHIDFIKSSLKSICENEKFSSGTVITGLLAKKMAVEASSRIPQQSTPVFRITRAALEGDQSGSCETCALNKHCEKEECKWDSWAERCLEFTPGWGKK